MTLGWILIASFAGGTLSAALASFSLMLRAAWVPMLVSYAIGALLGAAFLEVIPNAFAEDNASQAAMSILGGIFAFFVLVTSKNFQGTNVAKDQNGLAVTVNSGFFQLCPVAPGPSGLQVRPPSAE